MVGYLPTGRAGDTTMVGVDAQNRQIRTHRQHRHDRRGKRGNRTNRIKIRQKEIKVRMSDVSVAAVGGQSKAQGRHRSKDSLAFIRCF